MELKTDVLMRFMGKQHYLQLVEKLTGVPSKGVGAIWLLMHEGRISVKEKTGFYGLLPASWPSEQIYKEFAANIHGATHDEMQRIAKKGVGNFFCASLLLAIQLKALTPVLLYPDAPDEVLEDVLMKYGGQELVEVYRALQKVLND